MRKTIILLTLLSVTVLQAWSQIEVVNIENAAVQAYMADRTYEDPGTSTTTSVISTYNTNTYCSDRDVPVGKTVSWASTVSSTKIKEIDVTVSNSADYSDAKVYNPSKSATSYTIQNLVPGLTYYYKVEEVQTGGTTTTVAEGVFKTTGQVRMLCVDGVANFRDLGGWKTSFGVPIKYGKLYRSGRSNYVTSTGVQQFQDAGIGAELDLRSSSESKLTASPFGSSDYKVDFTIISNDKLKEGVSSSSGREKFAEDLRWIIARFKEGKSVDFHCKVGCDRTGTLAFLIEGLLGVCRNDLDRDFELSTFSGESRPRDYGSTGKGVGNYPGMWTYLLDNYKADDLSDTFYKYWKAIGMTDDELKYVRKEMLGIDVPLGTISNVEMLRGNLLGTGGVGIDANQDGKTDIADITKIISLMQK